jgi:hypothetical protein
MQPIVLRLFLSLLCLWPSLADAWGGKGHRLIAKVAAAHLTPEAKQEVRSLLWPRAMADVAHFPDDWKDTSHPDTARWHFVNIPLRANRYDPARDCPGGDCVIEAITRQRAVLADPTQLQRKRFEALVFLIHLVGDLHQPLHCADRGDRGGNDTPVSFFGERTNLHAVWDSELIERVHMREAAYVRELKALFPPQTVAALQRGGVTDWAREAHGLARPHAYHFPDGRALGRKYFAANIGVVNGQLAKAGVRLARVLNDALVGR